MDDTLPVAVMPVHDQEAILLPKLKAVGSELQGLFSTVLVGLTASTAMKQPEAVQQLRTDSVFRVLVHGKTMPVGAEFRALYTLASATYQPDQLLHLCFPDRLVMALDSTHRPDFVADIASVGPADAPLLFQRSESAWQSHPASYRQLEEMITTVGELLFGRRLDFAWCHLAVTAGQLAAVLPDASRRDLSFLAEIVVLLRDQIQTRDVDWLAWEDPYIFNRDPLKLKAEHDSDPAQIRKRLSYVVPMLDVLSKATPGRDRP
ncbi:MAG: hypothetical protein PVH18_09815 [Chloroflexota bacterium]|jgi:hypothetical protein